MPGRNLRLELGIGFTICLLSGCPAQKKTATSEEKLRGEMVTSQIELRGVTDQKVLSAMRKVPRHVFVPEPYTSLSYEDTPLPIGEGQTISQPYIVAYMTEVLKLQPRDKVLEIGTGSGYQAAILAELCDSVFSVEIYSSLAYRAVQALADLGYRNIQILCGDGHKGWPEHAPFNAIIVTCAPTNVPQPLTDQLAEGGRIIIPVGETFTQELYLLVKKNGKIQKHAVLPVRFVPMINKEVERY